MTAAIQAGQRIAPTAVADQVWVACAPVAETRSAHPGDLARAAGLPVWRATEFLAGRGLLRDLLAAVLPGTSTAWIGTDPHGKPGLVGRPDVGISVSHDQDTVAACVAVGRAIGVDVQRAPDSVADALLRRCLHDEAAQLRGLPADIRALEFAWVWTVQEACVKATGTGMAGAPWAIHVPPWQHEGNWAGLAWRSLRDLSAIPLSCAFGARTPEETR
ncbi:MAG TPA: 4'-phosphopantetheinyl transferase superfamily protein [Pseudonocardiaceae bacterium]